MFGPPTFLIGEFRIEPKIPESWSFSALRNFEDCPMRWALSHIVIACFGGRVPQKPNKSTVEGILLHELLERYDQYLKKPSEQRFRPRAVLLELVAAWNSKNERNPRINSRALADQIGIEDILRTFAEAGKYVQQPKYKGA